jgi:hypothetical protein
LQIGLALKALTTSRLTAVTARPHQLNPATISDGKHHRSAKGALVLPYAGDETGFDQAETEMLLMPGLELGKFWRTGVSFTLIKTIHRDLKRI